jgi:hypothetical protein
LNNACLSFHVCFLRSDKVNSCLTTNVMISFFQHVYFFYTVETWISQTVFTFVLVLDNTVPAALTKLKICFPAIITKKWEYGFSPQLQKWENSFLSYLQKWENSFLSYLQKWEYSFLSYLQKWEYSFTVGPCF